MAPPGLTQHHAERSPLSLRFLRWEKRAQRGHSAHPALASLFVGAPTLVSAHRDCRGIWLWQRMEEGLPTTSTQILADLFSTSGFAHLHNQVGGTVWRLKSVGCWSVLSQAGELSRSPTSCWVLHPALSNWKGRREDLDAAQSSDVQTERRTGKQSRHRAWRVSCYVQAGGVNSQPHHLLPLAPWPSGTESLFGKFRRCLKWALPPYPGKGAES